MRLLVITTVLQYCCVTAIHDRHIHVKQNIGRKGRAHTVEFRAANQVSFSDFNGIEERDDVETSPLEAIQYFISEESLPWCQALADCRNNDPPGHLLSIDTPEEKMFVENLLSQNDVRTVWTNGVFNTDKIRWEWYSENAAIPSFLTFAVPPSPNTLAGNQRVLYTKNQNRGWSLEAQMEKNAKRYVCEFPQPPMETTPARCQKEIDLMVVLDSSGSISEPDYVLGKQFAADLIEAFSDSVTTDVGFIIYSQGVQEILPLHAGDEERQDIYTDIVLNAPHHGSNTPTGPAIVFATNALKNHFHGAPQRIVVFTDGQSNEGISPIMAADAARDFGIELYSVGIGTGISGAELLGIAQYMENVIPLANFTNLVKKLHEISRDLCPALPIFQ